MPQVLFEAVKNSLEIDRLNCRRSSRRIALEPTGLLSLPQTVTPTYFGSANERCVTTKRVLVHLRKTCVSTGTP